MFRTILNTFRTMRRFASPSRDDIHVHAAKGNVDHLIALLDRKPKMVNRVDPMDFGTPLHWAAIYGQVESCKALIARGADLGLVDDCKQTPLWWAIRGGELQVIRFLLKSGADPNVEDSKGSTPLQYAVRKGKDAIAAVLRKYGASEGNE
jgi:ankyrin repeat protein